MSYPDVLKSCIDGRRSNKYSILLQAEARTITAVLSSYHFVLIFKLVSVCYMNDGLPLTLKSLFGAGTIMAVQRTYDLVAQYAIPNKGSAWKYTR